MHHFTHAVSLGHSTSRSNTQTLIAVKHAVKGCFLFLTFAHQELCLRSKHLKKFRGIKEITSSKHETYAFVLYFSDDKVSPEPNLGLFVVQTGGHPPKPRQCTRRYSLSRTRGVPPWIKIGTGGNWGPLFATPLNMSDERHAGSLQAPKSSSVFFLELVFGFFHSQHDPRLRSEPVGQRSTHTVPHSTLS